MSIKGLADLLNVHIVSVHRYLKGELPSNKVLARIIKESDGLVGIEDFNFDKEPKRNKQQST